MQKAGGRKVSENLKSCHTKQGLIGPIVHMSGFIHGQVKLTFTCPVHQQEHEAPLHTPWPFAPNHHQIWTGWPVSPEAAV